METAGNSSKGSRPGCFLPLGILSILHTDLIQLREQLVGHMLGVVLRAQDELDPLGRRVWGRETLELSRCCINTPPCSSSTHNMDAGTGQTMAMGLRDLISRLVSAGLERFRPGLSRRYRFYICSVHFWTGSGSRPTSHFTFAEQKNERCNLFFHVVSFYSHLFSPAQNS